MSANDPKRTDAEKSQAYQAGRLFDAADIAFHLVLTFQPGSF
jgi:hypothetical protein